MARSITSSSDFTNTTKAALAKRSGFQCAICQAATIGPSRRSPSSVTNVGIAAHISGARKGAARFDPFLSPVERADIANGIWLCGIHAKLIDDDPVTWTTRKLREVKSQHEKCVLHSLGVPKRRTVNQPRHVSHSQEYAFVFVRDFVPTYKAILAPMLHDKHLTDHAELGVLMCGSPPKAKRSRNRQTPWTVFVNADWLRWILKGLTGGYPIPTQIPPNYVYGQIPAWPDSFYEFLEAMVRTETTFKWRRNKQGFLVLAQ